TENRVRRVGKRAAQQSDKPDLTSFGDWARNPDRFWKHVLTFDIIEDTSNKLEFKVTECLWAKTFRDTEAPDIGYAVNCHADFAFAEGYSTNLRLVRTKTLMEGHDCCNFRYLWQT
ncbi:MAG: L-2-amino-thiazoline-4-carboxylic acid hydrolase, partial [Planctomycetota bacterium]